MINSFADKAFRDKAFNNAKDPKYDGFALVYLDLFQWFITFLIKKASGSGIKNENISNKELAEELHKPIIKKINKRNVHSPFIDNI